MITRSSGRSGAVLLEALVGVVLFGLVALAMIASLRQSSATVALGREREARSVAASRLLRQLRTWDAEALEAACGTSSRSGFTLSIASIGQGLFSVEVSDSAGAPALLRTSIYLGGAIAER